MLRSKSLLIEVETLTLPAGPSPGGGRKNGGEDCLPGSQGSVAMVLINSVGSGEAGLERRDPSGEVGGDKNQTVAVDARQVTGDGEVQLRSLEAKEGDDRMRLVEKQRKEKYKQQGRRT